MNQKRLLMPVAITFQILFWRLAMYKKADIKSALEKYCETEKSDDFGELLMTLKPMIKVILRKWWKYSMYHEDMIQEVFRILIKKHSDINKCKLLKLKANSSNGDNWNLLVHYYGHINGLVGRVAIRIGNLFCRETSYTFFWHAESWVGDMKYDERAEDFERGEE